VNRVARIVSLASHLGRGVQRIATDAVVGRVRSLPRTIGDLDAKALSQIMGRTVTSVVVIEGDAGTSSRARLALTGDGVPASVFVKLAAETTTTRLIGELGRLADTETRFYNQLAPELTGLPKAYGSALDPLTGRFVLVLEDLAADNCEFPDTCIRWTGTRPARSSNCSPVCMQRSGTARPAGCTPHRPTAPRYSPAPCQDVRAPDRGTQQHPRRSRSIHRRQLPRGRQTHRYAATHGHARRRPSRKHLLPQR